uniref:PiggyBac transposable element-derived protein 3-like n=1 Tax=Diabrotica virgifera virgifera TaxID=50390 RepID=A0A6P7FX29_DIAVI
MDKASRSYWKKPLTLAELLEEIEKEDIDVPDSIAILPPENANDDVTDEDSGEEDNVDIENLPGCQLRAECQVSVPNQSDSDDDKSLADFVEHKPKKFKKFKYSKRDLQSNFPTWIPIQSVNNQRSPATIFKLFMADIVEKITEYSNIYAQQKIL